jgi:hypothetical protein
MCRVAPERSACTWTSLRFAPLPSRAPCLPASQRWPVQAARWPITCLQPPATRLAWRRRAVGRELGGVIEEERAKCVERQERCLPVLDEGEEATRTDRDAQRDQRSVFNCATQGTAICAEGREAFWGQFVGQACSFCSLFLFGSDTDGEAVCRPTFKPVSLPNCFFCSPARLLQWLSLAAASPDRRRRRAPRKERRRNGDARKRMHTPISSLFLLLVDQWRMGKKLHSLRSHSRSHSGHTHSRGGFARGATPHPSPSRPCTRP